MGIIVVGVIRREVLDALDSYEFTAVSVGTSEEAIEVDWCKSASDDLPFIVFMWLVYADIVNLLYVGFAKVGLGLGKLIFVCVIDVAM